jgi:hypothetical protein
MSIGLREEIKHLDLQRVYVREIRVAEIEEADVQGI